MSSCSCRCLFFGGGGIVFLHAIKHESFRMQTFSSVRLRSCFQVPANANCFQPLCSCIMWKVEVWILIFAIQSLCTFVSYFKELTTYALGVCFCLWSWREPSGFVRVLVSSRPLLHLPLPWIHQTSAICVCLENIWTKKRNVQVFLYTCVIMNIYAYFCFVQLNKYICMSSLVFSCYFWCFHWLLILSITCLK